MDEQIPKSSKLQWINATLKFLKNDNQLILEYPEMPVQHMEYLHNLIWQRNNAVLEKKSMYSPVWDAMKVFNLKFLFKVFVNTSKDGNTGRLVIEKILKENQENDKSDNENLKNSEDKKKVESKPSNLPTHSLSKSQKRTPKQDKFFTDCRKIIDSISPALLRKGLQKMLDFLYSRMDASVTFSDLAPIEARFFENFLGIYNRRFEFQGLFSPACNDLLEKMSVFFKEFDKECKLEVYPSKHNVDFRKREVIFLKVPRYSRNTSKAIMSPVLKTTCYTEKASTVNNVTSCISNISPNSKIINKKLSASSAIHSMPFTSNAKNMLLKSFATKNISSEQNNFLSEINPIKTTKDCIQPPSNAIDKILSSSITINNISSTRTSNNVLLLSNISKDKLPNSSAFNKAITPTNAIKKLSEITNAMNKVQFTSDMTGCNAKNNVFNATSKMNNVPPPRTEDSTSNTRDIVQSPSLCVNNMPLSNAMKITQSTVEKNVVSSAKKVSAFCAIDNMSFSDSDKKTVPSASNPINKTKGTRKEKLLEAMSTPLESENGLRIMRSMGWEGGALGLRGEGLIEPIIPALHIVPGVGLGHEAPIKTKDKAKSKVDTDANKVVKVNNRLKFLATILDLLQRDQSIANVTYPVMLAKKEVLAFDNIINALNMRSHSCLTAMENFSLEKIEKIMAQNIQLYLRLDFSRDMSDLTIVKSFEDQIEIRSQKKNKKKKRKIDKTSTDETSSSKKLSKDELALHLCPDILNFMQCDDTQMVIAFDAVQFNKYLQFMTTVCECINRKVLIPYTPVRHFAVEILKVSRDRCVNLELEINKKSIVFHKTGYLITGSPNKRTELQHGGDMDTHNLKDTPEQKEGALTNSLDVTLEKSNAECLEATKSATSSTKISALGENKSPTDNIDIICGQIDSIIDNLNEYQSSNDAEAKITHKDSKNIEIDGIKTYEIDELTNDLEILVISDDDTDDESNEQHLESGKYAVDMSLSVLAENKEQISFTQNIYEQIDSLLEKLENFEKTNNTRAKYPHKSVDNINNNEIMENTCPQNAAKLSCNEIDIFCKKNYNRGSGIDVDGMDVHEASLIKMNDSKKQGDDLNINTNNLCGEVDPFINNVGKYVNKIAKSKSEVIKNESDTSNNNETVSYIFLVDTIHSHITVDEESSKYSREDRSAVTPVLIQDNSSIGDFEKLDNNNHNYDLSKELNELNNLIFTKASKKIPKKTKKIAVISIETDFRNINKNLVHNAIEALTSQNRIIDNIEELKIHNEIIKTNYYKSQHSIKVNDHLISAKSPKISEKIDISNASRKWYEHYENFLKGNHFVENINAHNPDNKKDIGNYIEENTLIEKDLKPINIDLNIYATKEKEETNFERNNKARSVKINVAINEPPHSLVIEEISFELKNVKLEPEHTNTIIDNTETLVLEPEMGHFMNAIDAIKVLKKVNEVSIKMDTKDVRKILNALRNLNSTEMTKCYDIIIIESDEYTTDELKNTVQKLILNNVALENDILPLIKYHGALDDGVVYSCHGKETCLWLKRVLSDFRVKDYRNVIDKHKMKIRVANFNENVNLLELLELYNAGIKSRDWTVIYQKQLNDVLIFGVEMNTASFRIVYANNFSLFTGFDVAQFSIGY